MIARSDLEKQLSSTLFEVSLSGFGQKIPGKVRDSFVVGDKRILVTSDRLSAFDRILTTIPFKGALLNTMAAFWFEQTRHIVRNHIVAHPHPNVFIARQVKIIPIEVVVRGFLAGSAWRDYQTGNPVSGIALPAGLKKSHRFEKPLLTPSTKAEHGKHDEPISSAEVVKRGIVSEKVWNVVAEKALALFAHGTKVAKERGLLLVDTKYEFGTITLPNGELEVVLADEIHTQDSSRYWVADSYQQRFERDEDPEMLDKEFFRRWLIERGYMGDGTPPEIPDNIRLDLAEKYMEVCEKMTGKSFSAAMGSPIPGIVAALEGARREGLV